MCQLCQPHDDSDGKERALLVQRQRDDPFTAWDVYAEDYIADKAFEYWYPMIAPNNITVLNNYTIKFVFTSGMQTQVPYILTQYLSMPYQVWKPVLQKVEKMNMTQAADYATNITRMWVPAWSLGPYYVVSVTPPAILEKLDPPNLLASWNQIFPYHTWQYYSPDYIVYQTPGTQAMDYLIAGTAASTTAFLSKAQYEVTEADGALVVLVPGDTMYGLTFNTTHYPLNIPQVRQALYYAINKTEVTDSWGLYMDDHNFSPFPPGTPLPHWLSSIMINFTYDPAKAASILEGLGFYKKNGIWYTPNGTEFTLAIQGPSGFIDWMTTVEDAANQLTKFGIPTTLYADSVGTYLGTMWPAADYQVGIYWLPGGFTYSGLQVPFGNPAGYFPTTKFASFNVSANVKYVWPNGTVAYLNLTKWHEEFAAETPGTAAYNASIAQYVAFMQYNCPTIPLQYYNYEDQYLPKVFNLTWVVQEPSTQHLAIASATSPLYGLQQAIVGYGLFGVNTGIDASDPMPLFGVAPPGVQSPLAEAIANHSVIPEWAAFFGLPASYSENYYASLAKAALSTSTISLAVSPTSTTAGTPVTLTATLTYANGTPASGIGITFTSDGTAIGTATTSSSGVATLSYTPTSAGTYTLTAYVTSVPSVSSTASLSVTSTTVTTPVPVVYPSLTLSVSPTSVTAGSPVTLTATATFPN
ncbi:MAG: ABC transporter substrate-binding protein, partial [Thermoprotei archaeon]